MNRHGVATLSLSVWGDWVTVIGAQNYRDALINQKPSDEDSAEYQEYTIPCANTKDLVDAYDVFRGRRLRCAITMAYKVKGEIKGYVSSDTGYGSYEPYFVIDVCYDKDKLRQSVGTAIEILQEAIK